MKKLLLLIALLLPALFVTAQGIKNGLKEEPKINVGIKGGFNSSMYFTSRLELDGERMEDVQNNYKVGYFAAMFFRVHMKRHFIQPEIMYNIYKGEIAFNKNQNKEMVILDAALLVESDYLNFIDKLLVVICNEDIQIERIKQRDNCSKEEALSRIKSQMSQEEKVKYADYIIDNSGTIEELRKKAFAFMDYIKEKCCE